MFRQELQALQQQTLASKIAEKQAQAQQDRTWEEAPAWSLADVQDKSRPWTVPSQLLTADEEVCSNIFEVNRGCMFSIHGPTAAGLQKDAANKLPSDMHSIKLLAGVAPQPGCASQPEEAWQAVACLASPKH